jgi:subtilisin family serine protease
MGLESNCLLSRGLLDILKGKPGPKRGELKLVLVIAESFLEKFNGNKPLPYFDHSMRERNQKLQQSIESAIKEQNYFADPDKWSFSYHCVYLTLKTSWKVEPAGVARIAPLGMISEIWHNDTYRTALDSSLSTVRVNHLRGQHQLNGKGIIWAVVDTGIKATHPGFGARVVRQDDLTGNNNPDDTDGHGTHVAGIIGGHLDAHIVQGYPYQQTDENGKHVSPISGVAPEVQLVSLKVIEKDGDSNNTDALEKALGLIASGAIVVHGVNLSLQNEPKEKHWCSGDCPVCKRIKEITGRNIIVCAAAGNRHGLRTICCPGRSERAITVGGCHKSEPLDFGIHSQSAGGPTPDGRQKPDVVAPGVDILSYGTQFTFGGSLYGRKTGTSMATAFVSGLCALLLEERREARRSSNCELMKTMLCNSAQTLQRDAALQGSGLINAVDALAESQQS